VADRTVFVDGTTRGTPGTNGAHYATLSAAIAGEVGAAPDLVTDAAILHIELNGSSAETAADAHLGVHDRRHPLRPRLCRVRIAA